jgi:hypothetical protein
MVAAQSRRCSPVNAGDLDIAGPSNGSGATRIEADLSIKQRRKF